MAAILLLVTASACSPSQIIGPVTDAFTVDVPERLGPLADSAPAQAAGVARDYLTSQGSAVPADTAHRDVNIINVKLVRAHDVPIWLDRVPEAATAGAPDDALVWLVLASGDFVNDRPWPWSSPSEPAGCGTLVVDDATRALLGVFPSESGYCPEGEIHRLG